jgi:PAS domain S-box-containing protein
LVGVPDVRRLVARLSALPAGRFVAVLAILSLGPVVLLAYFSVRLATEAATDEVKSRVRATASVTSDLIDFEMRGLAELVESYAGRPHLVDAVQGGDNDRVQVRRHLRELQVARQGIAIAFFADPSGRLIDIVPETPSIIGDDFSYRDWYKGVTATGGPYVSEAYQTAASGHPLVAAAAAEVRTTQLDGGTGKRLGILVAAYDFGTIDNFAGDFARAQRVNITVTDQRGVVVASPGGPISELVSRRDDPGIRGALAGRSRVRERESGDGDVLAAYAPIPTIGWTVSAEVPARVALAQVEDLRSTVVAIATVLALVLIGGLLLHAFTLRERRRAEAALHEEEEETRTVRSHMAAIVDGSEDAILSKELDGTIISWNNAAERLYGYRAGEIIGKNISTLAPPNKVHEIEELLGRIRQGERVDHFETIRVRKDGSHVPVSLTMSPIKGSEGQVIGASTIARDITERAQAAEALQAAKSEAEVANRAKSEFLSRMSHELRTPLNAVLGFAQLLEMDDLSEEQRENLREIAKGGRHLLDLINEVLDLASIETGRLALSLEPVAVADVVEESRRLIAPLASERGIELVGGDGCGELHVLADRQRLKQVLLNILANAVKYHREAGRATVACETQDDSVVIRVSDTGPGIPPESMARLFTPFDRLGAEGSDVEGTGLGLSLAKSLVEAMGGRLSIQSAMGHGTTAIVELPACSAPEMPAADDASLRPVAVDSGNGSHTILCIEDNLANLKLIQRVFSGRSNVEVLSSMQGSIGFDLAREHVPDLILLDLHLPDMSGQDVLTRLKGDPRTQAIPTIVISADATDKQKDRLLAAGARAYLTKPIDVQILLETVEKYLQRKDDGQHAT